jgi:D-alanyl-D-alanine carboxypeptidase (penicillin-binding protein 5/6)
MKAGRIAGMVFVAGMLATGSAWAARASIETLKHDPYVGAIVVDAWSGEVLFEDRADEPCYPASVIKLMDLLLILEDVERGEISLSDPVIATAEAARMGGSQVYLKEHEAFTADEMLYALMVQSANDAAVALAIWRTGSKEAFVPRMNARAAMLGMTSTRFESVHGLPPGAGQKPDISTARDLSRLGRALAERSDVLKYTSTKQRGFRDDTFGMSNHNHLLGQGGCDGLKTGYFKAGGYSSLTTAERDGRRVVVAVTGSPSRTIRDQNAARLLAEGLAKAKPRSGRPRPVETRTRRPQTSAAAPSPAQPEAAEDVAEEEKPSRGGLWSKLGLVGIGIMIGLVLAGIGRRRTL